MKGKTAMNKLLILTAARALCAPALPAKADPDNYPPYPSLRDLSDPICWDGNVNGAYAGADKDGKCPAGFILVPPVPVTFDDGYIGLEKFRPRPLNELTPQVHDVCHPEVSMSVLDDVPIEDRENMRALCIVYLKGMSRALHDVINRKSIVPHKDRWPKR
jgi:hypothetical protein